MVTTCRDGQGVESDTVVRYIGRRAAASPATGSTSKNNIFQTISVTIVNQILQNQCTKPFSIHKN